MNNLKISIIVPIYNVELYIRECFGSIAAQTYKGELECIFVDDCGQDKSVEILEGLMASYQGDIDFRLVHHKHNKGLSGARNTGVKNATGEYLYFLDSDDTITPDCIEKLGTLAEKYTGVEVVQGSTESKMTWLQLNGKHLPEYSCDFKWIKKTMLKRFVIPMTAWNKLVKRDFLLKYNLFFEEGIIHEDELWNFMLSKYVKAIAISKNTTYFYRENPNGIMDSDTDKSVSYSPVLNFMVERISQPYPCAEIMCAGSIAMRYHCDLYELLAKIRYNQVILKYLFSSLAGMCSTTKFSVKGIYYRLAYYGLTYFINKTLIKYEGSI